MCGDGEWVMCGKDRESNRSKHCLISCNNWYFSYLHPLFYYIFSQVPKNAQEDTQKAVKRIQLLMAALPDSKRPKTILELKDFVQQYSGLINKGSNFLSNYQTTPSSMCTSSSMGANSSSLPSNFSLSGRTRAQVAQALMGLPVQTQAPVGQTTTAMPVRSSLTRDAGETSRPPIPVPSAVGQRFPLSLPSLTSAMSSFLMGSDVGASKHQSSSSCGDVPVATQAHGISMSAVPSVIAETMTLRPPFGHKNPPAPMLPLTSSSTCQSASLSTSTTGIQAGVATPLPAGVTLETLGVLCRLPENDLLKLNLPLPLLSAIKVWKARQGPGKSKVHYDMCLFACAVPIQEACGLSIATFIFILHIP